MYALVMASKPKQPRGPPMDLGNMRKMGVQRLIAFCLNPICRHEGLINVSQYPDDVKVPSFAKKVICMKCGARGRHIDVRPNWKEVRRAVAEGTRGRQVTTVAEQYRARGRLCIERATRIPNAEYKELYFYNASQWVALADELEQQAVQSAAPSLSKLQILPPRLIQSIRSKHSV
jgi:hypothetical protein